MAPGGGINYSAVAWIEMGDDGKLNAVYRHAHLAKGRYSIDYDKIGELKKGGFFTKEELTELGPLIKHLEDVNLRKTVLHKLIENIIEFQKEFLLTGDKALLAPLSQLTVAKRMEISPSLLNRALFAKSLIIPAGSEVPLKDFFPSKKDVVKSLLEKLLVADKKGLKDDVLSNIILNLHGFRVSRHMVQIYRKELGFLPGAKRKRKGK